MRIPKIAPRKTRSAASTRRAAQSSQPIAEPLTSSAPVAGSIAAAATIAFALVFVGAIAAFALGALPSEALTFGGNVEAGVVLLFVPLCALIFAVLFEVMRGAMTGSFTPRTPNSENPHQAWRPGHGEG